MVATIKKNSKKRKPDFQLTEPASASNKAPKKARITNLSKVEMGPQVEAYLSILDPAALEQLTGVQRRQQVNSYECGAVWEAALECIGGAGKQLTIENSFKEVALLPQGERKQIWNKLKTRFNGRTTHEEMQSVEDNLDNIMSVAEENNYHLSEKNMDKLGIPNDGQERNNKGLRHTRAGMLNNVGNDDVRVKIEKMHPDPENKNKTVKKKKAPKVISPEMRQYNDRVSKYEQERDEHTKKDEERKHCRKELRETGKFW